MPRSTFVAASTNGTGWKAVTLNGSVPGGQLLDLIDHSYRLVMACPPAQDRTDTLNTWSCCSENAADQDSAAARNNQL
jgi:hypothetical protein